MGELHATDVSILGTGLMGAAIARRLREAGKSVTVWNRSPEKAADLVTDGISRADSARAALEASPISIVVIVGYDTVWDLIANAGADLSQIAVVNLSSGTPEQALALSRRFDALGGRLLEGCILAYPSDIGSEEATLVFSGPTEIWDRAADLLRLLGGRTQYAGPRPETANVIDVTILAFYTSAAAALLEAGAYARTYGLDFASLRPTLHEHVAALDRFVSAAADRISRQDYSVSQASLSIYLAAMEGVVEAMESSGFPVHVATGARDSVRLAQDAGRGDEDLYALYDALGSHP
jgi:3-hydroxyisobutyrate dehydrogenase-like beta-hydroxyacid dehydrogenase